MLVQYKDKWSVYNYTNQSTKSRAVLDLILANSFKFYFLQITHTIFQLIFAPHKNTISSL